MSIWQVLAQPGGGGSERSDRSRCSGMITGYQRWCFGKAVALLRQGTGKVRGDVQESSWGVQGWDEPATQGNVIWTI